jgi:hypothetical protein
MGGQHITEDGVMHYVKNQGQEYFQFHVQQLKLFQQVDTPTACGEVVHFGSVASLKKNFQIWEVRSNYCKRGADRIYVDVYLAFYNPEALISSFLAGWVDWATVHIETCPNLYKTLKPSKMRDAM